MIISSKTNNTHAHADLGRGFPPIKKLSFLILDRSSANVSSSDPADVTKNC